MHDYSCNIDVFETKKIDGPVKDEAPGKGSPGKICNSCKNSKEIYERVCSYSVDKKITIVKRSLC